MLSQMIQACASTPSLHALAVVLVEASKLFSVATVVIGSVRLRGRFRHNGGVVGWRSARGSGTRDRAGCVLCRAQRPKVIESGIPLSCGRLWPIIDSASPLNLYADGRVR